MKKAFQDTRNKNIFLAKLLSDEIQNLTKQVNYNNWKYYFKTKRSSPKYFIKYKLPLGFLRSLRNGEKTIEKSKRTKKELNQI